MLGSGLKQNLSFSEIYKIITMKKVCFIWGTICTLDVHWTYTVSVASTYH